MRRWEAVMNINIPPHHTPLDIATLECAEDDSMHDNSVKEETNEELNVGGIVNYKAAWRCFVVRSRQSTIVLHAEEFPTDENKDQSIPETIISAPFTTD